MLLELLMRAKTKNIFYLPLKFVATVKNLSWNIAFGLTESTNPKKNVNNFYIKFF